VTLLISYWTDGAYAVEASLTREPRRRRSSAVLPVERVRAHRSVVCSARAFVFFYIVR
jgi:hypothetical protein